MTEPGPGGHGDLDGVDLRTADLDGVSPADLEELRRTSPRRAARIEAELQRRAEGGATRTEEPPAAADGWVDPATGAWQDAHPEPAHAPHHEPVAHEPYPEPDGHEPYAEPVAHEPYPEPVHDSYAEPVEQVHPWDQPAHHYDPAFGDPVADGYVPTEVDEPEPRRGGRTVLRLLLMTVVVGAVGVAGWFAWQQISPLVDQVGEVELFAGSPDFEGPGEGSVEVVVNPGDSGRAMGATLEEAGVVASVDAFVEAANAEPRFTSVQPGTYTLPQGIPAAEAVAALLEPGNRVDDTVVIAEGLRLNQILDRLAERGGYDRDELEAALDTIELPTSAPSADEVLVHPAEGYLYPDGYRFPPDATAETVLQTMVDRNQQVLSELGVAQEDQLEVLTKASLIQGEARLADDFFRVARVVENRLEAGQPLGLDSTINYATQTFDTRTTAEQRETDSPYNSYTRAGLPPGPIKSPGRQAIEAVLAPAEGDWLYFATVNLCTGETAFAVEYSEHLRNVEVLNAWQRENTVDGQLQCD
jgi:UPF0755 protein